MDRTEALEGDREAFILTSKKLNRTNMLLAKILQ